MVSPASHLPDDQNILGLSSTVSFIFYNKNKGLGQLHPKESISALLLIRHLDPSGETVPSHAK